MFRKGCVVIGHMTDRKQKKNRHSSPVPLIVESFCWEAHRALRGSVGKEISRSRTAAASISFVGMHGLSKRILLLYNISCNKFQIPLLDYKWAPLFTLGTAFGKILL